MRRCVPILLAFAVAGTIGAVPGPGSLPQLPAARAAELPEQVPASRCTGRKKVFGFIDDGSSVRKFKMRNAFYVEAGSAFVQGCRTVRGEDTCQETLGIGLFLPEGPSVGTCGGASGVPYLDYTTAAGGGLSEGYWTATSCTVTVVKHDATRGRVSGTFVAEIAGGPPGGELATGRIVGCFRARRRDL